jgi:class 3 adenylate cyclase
VTFLFTDVEGSTRRWETDAELMRKALAAHDGVLRSAIEAYGGCLSSSRSQANLGVLDGSGVAGRGTAASCAHST